MNLDKVVCNCLNITNGDIKNAVYSGASTLEEVQEKTEEIAQALMEAN